MNQKVMIIAIAICAVAIIAVAALLLTSSNDNSNSWEKDLDKQFLSKEVKSGDFISFEDLRIDVLSVSDDKLSVSYNGSLKSITKEEFLSYLTPKKQMELYKNHLNAKFDLKYIGKEKLKSTSLLPDGSWYTTTTPYDVYSGTVDFDSNGSTKRTDAKLYVREDGMLYKFETDFDTATLTTNLSWFYD